MSILDERQSRIKSPVKYYIEFKHGSWRYWDAAQSASIQIPSLSFICVDVRSSVGGWSDEHESSIYSNMVKDLSEPLSIKTGKKVRVDLVKGVYKEIKSQIAALGGKFVSNVFALADIEGVFVPVNIQFSGASLRDWMEFVNQEKMFNVYTYLVTGVPGEEQKKGSVKYFTPSFSFVEAPDDLVDDAKQFAALELEDYLEQ